MNSIIHVIVLRLLLLVSCGYAHWRGRKHERMAALVFIAATLLSFFGESSVHRYVGIEITDLVVDNGVLLALVAIALVSDRFWPLWAAGLQLVDSMSHLMKAIDLDLLPKVYGAAERFWSFPILIILLVGAWRQHRRSHDQGEAASDSRLRQVVSARR
jgi:hypothetical protein